MTKQKNKLITETKFDKVIDSGKRQKFKTGAVRDIQEGKGRYDLIPPIAMQRLARHYENGAKKYGEHNWEKGIPLSRYIDSLIRHAYKLLLGMEDEDHAAAIAWNAFSYIYTKEMIDQGKLPKELNNITYKKKK
jgi:hypothetical protein